MLLSAREIGAEKDKREESDGSSCGRAGADSFLNMNFNRKPETADCAAAGEEKHADFTFFRDDRGK